MAGHGNLKTLVFCAPVRNIVKGLEDSVKKINAFHAKMCAAIFNGELKDKINESFFFDNHTQAGQFKHAAYLSSELPKKEREAILRAFRTIGRPPFILCTVGMLIEGFDFPDLENLILLRPTLSMRLFEQQVGRVTRLPRESIKKKGNIFEIVDDIDSLYDNFEDKVFQGETLERIQMLQPEYRIEELFTEDNTSKAFETGKIHISEINFGDTVGEFYTNSVEIPPTSMRVKYFCKLLSVVEKKTDGKLVTEKLRLMPMTLGFNLHDIDSAREISKLIALLDRLEHEVCEDYRLSSTCARCKPRVFREVRWLLLLTVLTRLKYSNTELGTKRKSEILGILGFSEDDAQIDNYRMHCLKEGCGIDNLDSLLNNIKTVELYREIASKCNKNALNYSFMKEYLALLIYWAPCFTEDHSGIRELLFESREWNYQAKKFIIGQK